MGWTPPAITHFTDCKANFIIYPLLLCYDSSKSTFLKMGQSAGGMDYIYILTQPDDFPASLVELKHLAVTGEYLFDLSFGGSRIHPVLFEYRANITYEGNYHAFVGEVACGRWIIATCRKHRWGILFD